MLLLQNGIFHSISRVLFFLAMKSSSHDIVGSIKQLRVLHMGRLSNWSLETPNELMFWETVVTIATKNYPHPWVRSCIQDAEQLRGEVLECQHAQQKVQHDAEADVSKLGTIDTGENRGMLGVRTKFQQRRRLISHSGILYTSFFLIQQFFFYQNSRLSNTFYRFSMLHQEIRWKEHKGSSHSGGTGSPGSVGTTGCTSTTKRGQRQQLCRFWTKS